MSAHCFLTTFHPLTETAAGRSAVEHYGLPPFIDGSCRREPDFESLFPSISALCRLGSFAPRLRKGDAVMYLTIKGKYQGDEMPGWRLVAVLRVIHHPFSDHREAARWYAEQRCQLPSNCLVPGNPPQAFDRTHGKLPDVVRRRTSGEADSVKTRCWDHTYWERAKRQPIFLVTQTEFLELTHPPQLQRPDMLKVFGYVPGTQTPPKIDCNHLRLLMKVATERKRQM